MTASPSAMARPPMPTLNTSLPSTTSPDIVCLPSSHIVGTNVRTNGLTSMPGPALASESNPPDECVTVDENSPPTSTPTCSGA